MADPQTSNVLFSVPTRGSDPGTWDLPVNGNSNALDGFLGGVQTVSASNANITLTSPAGTVTPTAGPTQAQNGVIRVTGVLTAAVQITLPLPGYIIIENLTTGAFVLSFRAVGTGEVIGIEQGSCQHIYNDGVNVRFVDLPPVGSYLDVCDAAVPAWITACTKPPYLNCDGTTFNATTYPYLNTKLGGNTLPDSRGNVAAYLNQGTGRLTTAAGGVDGNTRFAIGGTQTVALVAAQIPTIGVAVNVNVSGSISGQASGVVLTSGSGNGAATGVGFTGGNATVSGSFSGSGSGSGSSTNTGGANPAHPNVQPTMISGLRLIRAA